MALTTTVLESFIEDGDWVPDVPPPESSQVESEKLDARIRFGQTLDDVPAQEACQIESDHLEAGILYQIERLFGFKPGETFSDWQTTTSKKSCLES
jgi:hypothetical protein